MIEEFEELLGKVQREGMDKLISFIRKSDFYAAPASTKYHSCHEGGLLEHSMSVYKCLLEKKKNPTWQEHLKNIPEESLIIAALLHDLCKTYYYIVQYRNKKNDAGVWEQVPYYTVNDEVPYGHGEKSVMMIEEFIKLTPVERYAIRWHMGFTEQKENYNTLGTAIKRYPLILALHEADVESSYLFEKEE